MKPELLGRFGPPAVLFPSSSREWCIRPVNAGNGVSALPRVPWGKWPFDCGRVREVASGWLYGPLPFMAPFPGGPKSQMLEIEAQTARDVAKRSLRHQFASSQGTFQIDLVSRSADSSQAWKNRTCITASMT